MSNVTPCVPASVEQAYFPFAPSDLVHVQETSLHPGKPEKRVRVRETEADKRLAHLAKRWDYTPQPASHAETHFRHSGWAATRQKVIAALKRGVGNENRIERFVNCGSACMVQREVGGRALRCVANYCHDRFCLPCASARSRLIARNLSDFMAEEPATHMVLTLKHSDAPLTKQFDRLVKAFAELRRLKCWKLRIRGGGYFFEVKRSRDGKFYHPHLHCILIGSYLPQAELSAEWLRVTGDSSIVYLQAIRDKKEVVNYAAKYASKPLDPSIFRDPSWLDECLIALRGRRLCGCFGEWRGKGLEDPDPVERVWVNVGYLGHLISDAVAGGLGSLAVLKLLRPKWEVDLKGTGGRAIARPLADGS